MNGKGRWVNANLNGQIHAVKEMNVQGRQMRQEMQEMKWDRQRRDSGTQRDRGKPRCSWKDRWREAGSIEAAEEWSDTATGVAGHNARRRLGTGAHAGWMGRSRLGQDEMERGRRDSR